MCWLPFLFVKLNDVVEQHAFSTVAIPTTASEPLLLQKYIDSEDTTHENSLPPAEVIDLPYGAYYNSIMLTFLDLKLKTFIRKCLLL